MSINFEKSAIWADVKKVMAGNGISSLSRKKATMHTKFTDFDVISIVTLDYIRAYTKNISDSIHITFNVSLGDYTYNIYPYRDNLELTITTSILESSSNKTKPPATTERYKAIFLVKENTVVTSSQLGGVTKADLDLMGTVEVKLQLQNRSAEPLRIMTTSGIYQNEKVGNFLPGIIYNEATRVMIGGKPSIDGVDMAPNSNPKVIPNIILEQGTLLRKIPFILQEDIAGVFPTGIGSYIQTYKNKVIWFLYPLYDLTRFNSASNKMIIYAIPDGIYGGIDNTYIINGNLLSVLATSTKRYTDHGEANLMERGVGFRMADAGAFMTKPIQMGKNGPEGNPTNLNSFVGAKQREDGLDYAPVSSKGISSNLLAEYSKINAKMVSYVDFVWEHSDFTLIYPGMPCQYVYLEDGVVTRLNGIVHHVHAYIRASGNAVSPGPFLTSTAVRMAMELAPSPTSNKIKSIVTMKN